MPTPLGNPGGNVSPDLPPFFTSLLCAHSYVNGILEGVKR
jgi:hypothetical protein